MYSPRTSFFATQGTLLHKIFASLLQVNTASKLLFIGVATGFLIYGDLQGWSLTRYFRLTLMDVTTPVWSVTHDATHWIHERAQYIQQHFSVMEENQRLRMQLEQLPHWRNIANQLTAENKHLKQFLKVPAPSVQPIVTAKVVTSPYAPSNQTLIINAGRIQGIEKYQPVIVPQGLVGRIIEVGDNSARVLLITDPRSRISVRGEASTFQAIIAGNQGHSLKIVHHRAHKTDVSSQRLLTSGKGNIFPDGLMVASMDVVGAPENQTMIIEPVVAWKDLDYVQVISGPLSENLPHD